MKTIDEKKVYIGSEDVVAREIEGEFILVPIASGIGDMEDAIYTLNETGRAVWNVLDGRTSVVGLAERLAAEYDADEGVILEDIKGILGALFSLGMVVEL